MPFLGALDRPILNDRAVFDPKERPLSLESLRALIHTAIVVLAIASAALVAVEKLLGTTEHGGEIPR
jgi:hypothetical protein